MQEGYRDASITGLANARALEVQAIQLLSRQIERVQSCPEVEAALHRHLARTGQQRDRLDAILEAQGTSHASVKDFMTGFMDDMAALGHVPMRDEIIENALANCAFEHFEIASCGSLLTLADLAGDTRDAEALRTSLAEALRKPQWCEDSLEPITRKYAMLQAEGEKAGM